MQAMTFTIFVRWQDANGLGPEVAEATDVLGERVAQKVEDYERAGGVVRAEADGWHDIGQASR